MTQLFQTYAITGSLGSIALLWVGLPQETFWWVNIFLIVSASTGIIWNMSREPHAHT